MHLFEFSPELFEEILLCAVLARGVKRAVRLRLVCKKFSKEIHYALLRSGLLDSYNYNGTATYNWPAGNDRGATTLWTSYILYRSLHQKTADTIKDVFFLRARRVAECICENTGAELMPTLKKLCLPAGRTLPCFSDLSRSLPKTKVEQDLLGAAAYLNLIPMADQLLQEGHCPANDSFLFWASPIALAALAGNTEILELFQEHLLESECANTRVTSFSSFNLTRMEAGWLGSIEGAAELGDINTVHLAVGALLHDQLISRHFDGQGHGNFVRRSPLKHEVRDSQRCTRNIEVYEYLETLFEEPNNKRPDDEEADDMKLDNESHALIHHVQRGNLEMVRYFCHLGADIHGSSKFSRPEVLLVSACQWYQEDIVDFLLERGADPNNKTIMDNAIFVAAKRGSLAIVRKLLKYGGDISILDQNGRSVGYMVLIAALRLEHTGMVKLIFDSGIDFSPYKDKLLKHTISNGLESMTELLQREFATAT